MPSRAHAPRSTTARSRGAGRSPVFSSRRRLDLILLLFLRLHVALFTRRTAEELLGLGLSESALWLRRLTLWRLVGSASAAAATTTLFFLPERQLVVPLCVEIGWAHQ